MNLLFWSNGIQKIYRKHYLINGGMLEIYWLTQNTLQYISWEFSSGDDNKVWYYRPEKMPRILQVDSRTTNLKNREK